MIPALTTAAPKAAETAEKDVSGFRLGEDQLSDTSCSDSDQSAHSERDLSPTRNGTKVSRSKKRRALRQERRQVGALTDELGILLGAAFQKPNDNSITTGAASGDAGITNVDEVMEVETISAEKKLSRRTRQNLLKMEKRKLTRERQQHRQIHTQTAAERRDLPLGEYQKRQNQSKKNTTQARRLRKEKERARKAGTEAMDIG